jgi:hypothetical protein
VGEVGDGRRSLKTVAAYTNGGDKLHMCYTFDMLGGEFSAEHFRRSIANFQSVVQDGWSAGPSPTMMSSGTSRAGSGTGMTSSTWPGSRSPCCLHSGDRSVFTRAKNWGWKKPISRSRI